VHAMLVLDMSARLSDDLGVRFAALCHDLGKGTTPPGQWPSHKGHEERSVELLAGVCERYRVPVRCRDLAVITARYHGLAHKVDELRSATILDMLEGADAFRRPERFKQMLTACESDFRGRTDYEERAYPQGQTLRRLQAAAAALDVGRIAGEAERPELIPQHIRSARIGAIERARG